MPFRDMLLQIDTYPEATADRAIDQAVAFARLVGGRVSALAVQVDIPLRSNRIADHLIGLSVLAEDEEVKSRTAAHAALARFSEQARNAGVFSAALTVHADLYEVSNRVVAEAKSRDLCLVPLGVEFDDQREVAQTLAFGSGRPVVVYRPGQADLPTARLGTIVLAWDGSAVCARAMHEALPLLRQAQEVRVVTFVGEKASAVAGLGAQAVRHLHQYDVQVIGEDVPGHGPIGERLDAYLAALTPDLLVMGAYGHSRLREFVLGGATEHTLHRPRVATFLAH